MAIKHGHCSRTYQSGEYRSWNSMMTRCNAPNAYYYDQYGGRGIKVCKRWRKFENFLDDMGNKPSKSHSIDRIDNDGDYTPENCRWATKKQQGRNRRNNRLLKVDGEIKPMSEWAELIGHRDRTVIYNRLKRGWSEEDAVLKPVQHNNIA